MKKKLLFVFNQFSGKGKIKNRLCKIIDIMVKGGYEVTVHSTQGREDAKNLIARDASRYDLIVCSGGDGTLDEAVTGLVQSEVRVPLGYIPAGSTNDFANSLKLPKDMLKAAEVAVSGRHFPVDVGEFNDDYFIYVAAFGLFTDVSYQTSQGMKNVLGHAAYLLEGVKSLTNIPSYEMQVTYADQVIEGSFILGMVTNSISVGGFKGLTGKHVRLDDGLYEVTLVKAPRNPLGLSEIINALTKHRNDTELVYAFKTDELKVHAAKNIPWTLDGEFGGDHMDVEIHNHCRALEIMVKI